MRTILAFAVAFCTAAAPALAADAKAPPVDPDAARGARKPAVAPAADPDAARAKRLAPNAVPPKKPAAAVPAPSPVPAPAGTIAVDLGACVRNYGCALKGNAPGKYKSTVSQKKAAYKVGEAVDVSYAGMPATASNWITIVPAGQEENSWCSWQWATGAGGTQQYGGLPAGKYEVRMYYGWSEGQCEVIGRRKFEVK